MKRILVSLFAMALIGSVQAQQNVAENTEIRTQLMGVGTSSFALKVVNKQACPTAIEVTYLRGHVTSPVLAYNDSVTLTVEGALICNEKVIARALGNCSNGGNSAGALSTNFCNPVLPVHFIYFNVKRKH